MELKLGRQPSEMTRFRYDVVIRKRGGTPRLPTVANTRQAPEPCTLEALKTIVRSGPTSLRITGIPNARVSAPLAALRALHARSPADRLGEIAAGPLRGSIPKTCAHSTRTMRWPSSGRPQDRDISMLSSGREQRQKRLWLRRKWQRRKERQVLLSPRLTCPPTQTAPRSERSRGPISCPHCDNICAALCRST